MIAHKYDVKDLVEICDEYLSETIHITEENVLEWVIFVERYANLEFKNLCKRSMKNNTR